MVGVNVATVEIIMGPAVPTHSAQHGVGEAATKLVRVVLPIEVFLLTNLS